jgi:hypothetical protein
MDYSMSPGPQDLTELTKALCQQRNCSLIRELGAGAHKRAYLIEKDGVRYAFKIAPMGYSRPRAGNVFGRLPLAGGLLFTKTVHFPRCNFYRNLTKAEDRVKSAYATSALVLVALASCATTQSNMMASVDRLERSADEFDTDTHGYFRNAAEFADQAHDFRATVDRAGDREVIVAYERLWRSYQALRQEVQGSDSPQAQVALKPVTQAFRGVVRGVSGYADSAVYARGGYQHDPYYDP